MGQFSRALLLISIVLAVPIVPLLIWGELFAGLVAQWQTAPPPQWMLAAAVIAILASDIVLPVPSGPVSTLAGAGLGAMWGTLACWLGMTIGATAAFALARRWGRPLAQRLAPAEDLARMSAACQRHDVWMLLATRPLPILAEACVLMCGTLQSSWPRFLAAVATSNLAIAAAYAAMGRYAIASGWLPLAVCVSLAVPVALTLGVRRTMRPRDRSCH
jgi:uncharacterized membrane protein YdjX (TVP38/TMEM64 family)